MNIQVNSNGQNENFNFKGLSEIQKKSAQILKNLKFDVSGYKDLKSLRKDFREKVVLANKTAILAENQTVINSEFSDIVFNPEITKNWLNKR